MSMEFVGLGMKLWMCTNQRWWLSFVTTTSLWLDVAVDTVLHLTRDSISHHEPWMQPYGPGLIRHLWEQMFPVRHVEKSESKKHVISKKKFFLQQYFLLSQAIKDGLGVHWEIVKAWTGGATFCALFRTFLNFHCVHPWNCCNAILQN